MLSVAVQNAANEQALFSRGAVLMQFACAHARYRSSVYVMPLACLGLANLEPTSPTKDTQLTT